MADPDPWRTLLYATHGCSLIALGLLGALTIRVGPAWAWLPAGLAVFPAVWLLGHLVLATRRQSDS